MITEQMRADGWIEHDGRWCKISANVAIYCLLRCGIMGWAMPHAKAWEWGIQDMGNGTSMLSCQPTDIVAYQEPKP